jgi:predicted DsbA family dithiol-disulfide isomerase
MDASGERLIVYGDYTCPYCYLAEAQLRRVREAGVQTDYRAFELRPAPGPTLDPAVPWIAASWQRTIGPLAARWGVEIRFPAAVPRTRKAHEAAAHARERGAFQPMHDAILHAYWVEGRDIGRIDVLVAIAEAVGLDRTETRVVLDVDTHRDRVIEESREAAELGITGVPAFRTASGLLTGLQPAEALVRLAGSGTAQEGG